MTSANSVAPIDRRDLKRLLELQLNNLKRDDVKVRVSFIVEFGDEDINLNTVVDPYQPFPRWKAKRLVEAVIEELDKKFAENEKRASTALAIIPAEPTPVVKAEGEVPKLPADFDDGPIPY